MTAAADSTTGGRAAALAALAAAAGRSDAQVEEDADAGLVRIRDEVSPTLELLEGDILTSPGVWHFDEPPIGPPDSAPTWRGFLVHVGSAGRADVIRLGDRAALVESWSKLADWLTPFELASLIARYFGREAGLAVHHTVLSSRADGERLLADAVDLPEKVGPPRQTDPRPTDGLVTLSFFSSFLEPGDEGQPTIGLSYWKARWGPALPLAWDSLVICRRLRSRFAP